MESNWVNFFESHFYTLINNECTNLNVDKEEDIENTIDNLIKAYDDKYRIRYSNLYSDYDEKRFRFIFIFLHKEINELFDELNYNYKRDTITHKYTASYPEYLFELVEDILELSNKEIQLDKQYYKNLKELANISVDGDEEIYIEEKIAIIKYENIFKAPNYDFISRNGSIQNFGFKKGRQLGEGSYAIVNLLKNETIDLKLAIKTAKKNIEDEDLKRFKDEYEYLKKCNSVNIVKAYVYNEDNNSYILDLCDIDLQKYILENNNKLLDNDRIDLVYQFLNALKNIHSQGLLHRDLSFKNVLLKHYDDATLLKLSDFGTVKNLKKQGFTKSNAEKIGFINRIDNTLTEFNKYEIRNEIFSMAYIIHFILTGKTKDTIEFNTKMTEEYKKFIHKCTNENIEERYSNIETVISELDKINIFENKE